MCVACLEFLKDKMTVKEFRVALGETTRNDPAHRSEVDLMIAKSEGDPVELKKVLRDQDQKK